MENKNIVIFNKFKGLKLFGVYKKGNYFVLAIENKGPILSFSSSSTVRQLIGLSFALSSTDNR